MAVIAKQRYKLDIAPKGGWVIVYASQHDNGAREIEFEITNQGNAFSIPASINVSVQGIKSNKSYFSHSCSYSGSIVTMALADDMTDVIGKVICVLKFTNQSNQKLATAKFVLNVDTDSSSEGVIIDTEAEEIFNQMLNDIRAQAASISADIAELQSMVGSPLVASTVSGMTNHNKIYVYTGSETGYTNGNWYYWNGSAWTSGGVYNSVAVNMDSTPIQGSTNTVSSGGVYDALHNTDTTLSQSGQSADAKVVGDATGSIKDRLHIVDGLMWNNPDDFQVGNITISTSGLAYDTTNRKRVTTKEGVTIPLNIGDVIRLTDYSDARFYVGWRRKNGTYGQQGWNISDFVCTEAGDYVINITNITEVGLQGDKFKLLNLLEVVRYSEIAFVRKERFYGNMYVPVEPGRIAISTSGWDYSPNAWYVRTKEHAVLNLCKGDVLGLKDFSKYSCFVGWRTSNGTYKIGGRWFDSAYTVTEDGAYVVCIRQGTGQTITDVDEALAQLYVSHTYNYHDIVDENETKMIAQSVVDNASISSFVIGVNHRGFNTVAPENTLPAYKLSRLNGFRYAETDVAFTGDGIPVLLHDGTINRTARNADGTELSSTINIYDITYEQALEYDFGIWKGEKYAGTKIPTFEQFISLCRNIGLHPYVELKTDGGYTEAQIAECVGIVKRYKMEEQSTFISFSATFLGYVKTAYPKARLGFLCNEITAENINPVKNLRTSDNNVFINAANAYITDQSISLAVNENIPVEVWTVNRKDTIIALNPYISGVTSDSVVASKVLSEYALED